MAVPAKAETRTPPPLPPPPAPAATGAAEPAPVVFTGDLADEIAATAAAPLGRDDGPGKPADAAVEAGQAVIAQPAAAVVPAARPPRVRPAPPPPVAPSDVLTEPITGYVRRPIVLRSRRFCTERRHSMTSLIDAAMSMLWAGRDEAQLDEYLRAQGYVGKKRPDASKASGARDAS